MIFRIYRSETLTPLWVISISTGGDIDIQRNVRVCAHGDGVEVGMLLQQGDAARLNRGRAVCLGFSGCRLLQALAQRGARGRAERLKEGIIPKCFNMIVIALSLREQSHVGRDDIAVGNVRVLCPRDNRGIQAVP